MREQTEARYEYTESGIGFHRFELWFGLTSGRPGYFVGLIHSEEQARKICNAMNAYHGMKPVAAAVRVES